MKDRYFAVMADPTVTPDEINALTQYLRDTAAMFGFWHYFTHSWLIHTTSAEPKATDLRDKAKELFAGKGVLVLEVTVKDWAVASPAKSHAWLHRNLTLSEPAHPQFPSQDP